ncbi:MAG: pentapeptide repeat-containing protein [Elainellaceae cyanobacterium]
MTIAEHLALIRQGVEAWNEWRKKDPATPNLSQANLSHVTLTQINFKWADLNQANLSHADLSDANLTWANLSQANLNQANLEQTMLRWANLTQVNLSQANLTNADFRGANLRLANLSRADLSNAELSGQDRNGVILIGADLKDANFNRANLSQANLSRADLSRANLSEANLTNVDLNRACLHGVDLRGTTLIGTILRDTDLRRANLIGVDLSGMDLSGVDLSEANLIRTNLNGANLTGANLSRANLFRTQAIGTNFAHAILSGASVEDWNVDSTTNFDGVIWEEPLPVFSDRADDDNGQINEPAHIDKTPVLDTVKLPPPISNTIDLRFDDGIDWRAVLLSIDDVQVKYGVPDIVIQAIERQPNEAILIQLITLPDIDAEELEQAIRERYDIQLEALAASYRTEWQATDEQIVLYRQQSTHLMEVVKLQATVLTQIEAAKPAELPSQDDVPNQDHKEETASHPQPSESPSPIKMNSELRRAILSGLDAYESPIIDRS